MAPQLTYTEENHQLRVLKVIEKKPNSNLIDLSVFEHLEDKTNVRVSVLEAFDPLLVKTEDPQETIPPVKDSNDGK